MGSSFDFSVIWDNFGVLLAGAWLTLRISLLAVTFGLPIGIVSSLCQTFGHRLLKGISLAYVEVICNIPYLI